MTYAADKQLDARWTVPADIRTSSLEELWLACAHADANEARRLLLHEKRRDAALTFDGVHATFFACSAAFDGDALKAEVANALANGLISDIDLPELLVPLLTTMRTQALDTLETLMLDAKFSSSRSLTPLLTLLRAIRMRDAPLSVHLYRDYVRNETHTLRSSLVFFRALEFGMPALAALYLYNYNFRRRDYLSEKLIAAAHHGHTALVRTLLDTHFDHEPVNCVAVRAALGNSHVACAKLILADKHFRPRDDLNDLAGFETQPCFFECERLLLARVAAAAAAAVAREGR